MILNVTDDVSLLTVKLSLKSLIPKSLGSIPVPKIAYGTVTPSATPCVVNVIVTESPSLTLTLSVVSTNV